MVAVAGGVEGIQRQGLDVGGGNEAAAVAQSEFLEHRVGMRAAFYRGDQLVVEALVAEEHGAFGAHPDDRRFDIAGG